ncbi:methyltransferase domain-containing protein [Ilumatobacter sp.]|uniref:methyltransferase domain-containing protein n=1 Tax=Ilumatobacter sp. TaxID=1967498 RepID=UPI003C53B1A1
MGNRASQVVTKAARSTVGFAARRIAANEWLMGVVYDHMNEANFAGLAEHEEMLSDSVRVDAYRRGIHRNVQPGDVVLDLGTGTGLLAFMASRAGAKKVYAVEHSDFIEVAREIAQHNGFTNIEFVQANSREFTPPEPIDVVLHEQMGDELFNENMLQNVLDLRDRVLRPGGRILPARFRLFAEPVAFHESMRIRRFWNIDLPDGIDLSCTEQSPIATRFDTGRNEQFWARPGSVASTIGEPRPILEFDLHDLESLDSLDTDHLIERTAATDTIVDGYCVWFDAVFDDATALSTSPLAPLTSWGNRVFRLDREIAAGEKLRANLRMGQLFEPSTWYVVPLD